MNPIDTSNRVLTAPEVQSDATKKVASQAATEDADNTSSAAVSPAYTVEISEEGMNAFTASSTPNAASAAASAPNAANAASTLTSAASATSTTTSSSSTSPILTSYSDSQLKQMLSANKITQSQYNTELARRTEANEEQATSSSTSVTNEANSVSDDKNEVG